MNSPKESQNKTTQTEGDNKTNSPLNDIASQFIETKEVNVEKLLPTQNVEKLLPTQTDINLKIQQKQEETRSELATFLVKILYRTLIGSFVLVAGLIVASITVEEKKADSLAKNTTLVKDLITYLLTAQTGLIGTALGFYFGSQTNNKSD